MGGAGALGLTTRSQLAIYNLRQPDDSINEGSGPPVLKVLGLREAIQLVDQIRDFPFRDAGRHHSPVLNRKIDPRTIDPQSFSKLQDEVPQSLFGGMFVLKRIIRDSRFQEWVLKPGVKIGSQTIKRGAAISSRVGDLSR